jgi:2-dehydro-3-deoxygluconokinase
VAVARTAGTLVSLDYNYRAALWSHEQAADELLELTRLADVVFAGDDEAGLVVSGDTPADLAAALAALGPRVAVVKLGAAGAVAHVDGTCHAVAAVPVRVVDPVGAGDAFVAGYLVEHLAGLGPEACLATAAACGAFAVTVPGDWEGLPSRSELALLGQAAGTVLR